MPTSHERRLEVLQYLCDAGIASLTMNGAKWNIGSKRVSDVTMKDLFSRDLVVCINETMAKPSVAGVAFVQRFSHQKAQV